MPDGQFFAKKRIFSSIRGLDSVSKSHRHKRAISRWVNRLPYKCKAFWGVKCDLWIGILFSPTSLSMGQILGVKNPPESGRVIRLRLARGRPTNRRKRQPLGAGKHAAELG